MDIKKQNASLAKISKAVFGTAARLQVVAPAELVLLKQNARYFKRDTFKQLVENIRADERLSSVPLCHVVKGGELEVLSGNHRVKACIEAGLNHILVMVLLENIKEGKKIATQLSHNALVGEDDPAILAELWAKIKTVKEKLYAGLSSDMIKDLESIKLVTFTTPQIYTRSVTFAFTDPEMDQLNAVLDLLGVKSTDAVYVAHLNEFDGFFETLKEIKRTENVKNASLAMVKLIEIAAAHIELAKEVETCPS